MVSTSKEGIKKYVILFKWKGIKSKIKQLKIYVDIA